MTTRPATRTIATALALAALLSGCSVPFRGRSFGPTAHASCDGPTTLVEPRAGAFGGGTLILAYGGSSSLRPCAIELGADGRLRVRAASPPVQTADIRPWCATADAGAPQLRDAVRRYPPPAARDLDRGCVAVDASCSPCAVEMGSRPQLPEQIARFGPCDQRRGDG